MAHVMIGEPSTDVRELLVRMVERLGHEPHVADATTPRTSPDLLLFEPESPAFLELAQTLRSRSPGLPLVVCSIRPPTDETRALAPVRHLMKPFLRAELAEALERAAAADRSQPAPD